MGRGGAFDRDVLKEVRFTLAAPCESVEHLSFDRPRRDGIDAHAGLGTLKRRSLGQTFNCVFARGIHRSIRRADLTQYGGQIDDAAAALLGHRAHLVLHAKEGAEDICVEHGGVAFLGLLGHGTRMTLGAGIVDGNVEPAKRFTV